VPDVDDRIVSRWRAAAPRLLFVVDKIAAGTALRDLLAAMAGGSLGASRILLVADQFEETFTLTTDADVRRECIEALLAAARIDGSAPVHVLIAMRADFSAPPAWITRR
jgi:hypothetical protein